MEFSMSAMDVATTKASIEQVTRKLLYAELELMGIDATSKVGLHVIDTFRVNLHEQAAYTQDQIYDCIERMEA